MKLWNDEPCSGLGASIARMVLFIEVETGGAAYLFSDPERKFSWSLLLNLLVLPSNLADLPFMQA